MINPFENDKKEIVFPWQPTLDRVFLYPLPPPEKYGSGLFEIPVFVREFYKPPKAILLAIGPGFFDAKGRWIAVTDQLKLGSLVCYDITVPWEYLVKGQDDKYHTVVMCGVNDIYGVFHE